MSQKPNTKLIGLFVVGACFAAFFTLLMLQGGSWFRHKSNYVLFFENPVDGLQVGSQVLFRGVPIGSVTDIKVKIDPNNSKVVLTPVYIEIEPHLIKGLGSNQEADKNMDYLVSRGLRATLEKLSFLTGVLQITFDFKPRSPIIYHVHEKDIKELPTAPSTLEQLTAIIDKIAQLPLDQIVKDIQAGFSGFKDLMKSPQLTDSLKNLDLTLQSAQKISVDLEQTAKPTMDRIHAAADSTDKAAQSAHQAFQRAAIMVDENGSTRVNLDKSLKEFSQAVHSIRQLSEELERDPGSILRGKSNSGDVP
jgi:paraquat-inducible protein B